MKDINITELSSITIKDRDSDAYNSNAPSDGTLVLGKVSNQTIATIVNNDNYIPGVAGVDNKNNYQVRDGTLVYNSDSKAAQFFYNGEPSDILSLAVDVNNPVKAGQIINIGVDGKATNLKAGPGVIKQVGDKDESFIIHEKRRSALREQGVEVTMNSTSLSDIGYIQFTNDTDANSEGFMYLDTSPAIVLQHKTGGSGSGTYGNVCTTITGGGLNASSTSPNAVLEINCATGGFLPSRLTQDQISALSLSSLDKGLIVYNTTTSELNLCNGVGFDRIATISPQAPSIVKGSDVLKGTTAVVISTNAVLETSQIFVTPQLTGTTINPATTGTLRVGNIIPGTSFSVYSTVAGDTAAFSWVIFN